MDNCDEISCLCLQIICSATCILDINQRDKKKKRTRVWVKPWRLRREERGSYNFLYNELRFEDKHAYRQYLRMDENCFVELLSYVQTTIQKQDTLMRAAIPAAEILAMFLRFVATGESFRSLDYQTRLSVSFISNILSTCSKALYSSLKKKYLKFPSSTSDWKNVAEGFANKWQFPLCLGALDGKHIAFRASKADGAYYYNYKGFNSIVLLAMCSADYKFLFVDIGCNGRVSDSGVLNRSDLRIVLNNPETYFPADEIIGNNRLLPYSIIGDDAFALEKHMLKPYPYNSKDKSKQIFNFRLSHARQTIEHTFGILANRFRVLQTQIHLRPEKVKQIVQVCCVLHNYLLEKSTIGTESYPTGPKPHSAEDNLQAAPKKYSTIASSIRDNFSEYFSMEGEIPWQNNYL